jgi:dihydrofolate reductase
MTKQKSGDLAMRRIRYQVAASLDGYIAGPNGETSWIITDPEIDFRAIFAQFDTLLMGRRTFEAMKHEGNAGMPGMRTFVFSRSLREVDYPDLNIISENLEERVTVIKEEPGKDIWLFGGGLLFRSLLEAGLVDTVEIAVIPVLLGNGIPLLPSGGKEGLRLTNHKVFSKSGIVLLEYAVIDHSK